MKSSQENLAHYFLAAAQQERAQVYFWNGPRQVEKFNYGQLFREAQQVAGFLQNQGVQRGQRVALVLPTHPDFYRAFFGVILAGAIPAALYPPIRLGRIEEWKQNTARMLKSVDCQAVLTNSSLHALLGYPVREARLARGCFTVNEAISSGMAPASAISVDSDEIAFIQFSSGTTEFPKAIALSHENVLHMAKFFLAMVPGDPREHHCVSWLPVYHDMGLIGALMSTMMAPANLTLIPPEQFLSRPKTWLEAMSQMKGTISVAPNFAYGLCCKRIRENELEGLDLSHWQVALCGAEPVQAETLRLFAERFAGVGFAAKALTPAYGLAEATLAVTLSPVDELPRETHFDRDKLELKGIAEVSGQGVSLVSLGPPIPELELEIRDDSGQTLSENRAGHVWVRGPNVMRGYFENPEATQKIIVQGWLNTGDRGFLHEGNLYLCGRYKDLIIIRGKNFDPAPLEESLDAITGIRTGCSIAFGENDPDSDTERLVILAEITKEERENRVRVASEIQEKILTLFHLSVSEVVLIEPGTLPRTSSGKKQRQRAKQLWREQSLTPPEKRLAWVYFREKMKGYIQHKRS